MAKNSKLMIFFPGIGYTNDRPLLYYTGKMAASEFGFTLKKVSYRGLPDKVKGDPVKMKEAFQAALRSAEDDLELDFSAYSEIVMVSKSIGTAAAGAYAKKHDLCCRNIYYTPLEETFSWIRPESGIAFHGTADPWAGDEAVIRGCEKLRIPLTVIENANHSLETGDVRKDIFNLGQMMEQVYQFLSTV
ncbi:MAG TPA: alpha/beta hydrolase [Lachnospiraceae bacterium]|nr:alpha/beta hydrolase [Lachnospiraceae bacterium]